MLLLLTLLYKKNNNSKLIFWIFTLSNFLLIILNYNPIILENLNSDIILLLSKPKDLINSFNFIISLLIIYDILIKGIKLSDPLRLNKKPLSLGIAGDSSTGKDTIVESFMKIIPKQSIQHISGDDYHLWDRKKENWKIITHLNPMANNLYKLSEDLLDLINNKFIYKRHYDHKSGKMTRSERINSRELLISSGLHTLYIPYSNNLFDLRVFVSMDEKLRTSLKINRDVKERGKSIDKVLKSLKERKIDSNNFIKVQKSNADIIFELSSVQSFDYNKTINIDQSKLLLNIFIRKTFNFREIHQTFVGILGLNCSLEIIDFDYIKIQTNCNVSSEQIALGAKVLLNDFDEFMKDDPKWEKNSSGLIQLLILNQIEKQRKYSKL